MLNGAENNEREQLKNALLSLNEARGVPRHRIDAWVPEVVDAILSDDTDSLKWMMIRETAKQGAMDLEETDQQGAADLLRSLDRDTWLEALERVNRAMIKKGYRSDEDDKIRRALGMGVFGFLYTLERVSRNCVALSASENLRKAAQDDTLDTDALRARILEISQSLKKYATT